MFETVPGAGIVGVLHSRIDDQDHGLLGTALTVDHDEPLLPSGLLPVQLATIVSFPVVTQLDDVSLAAPVLERVR